MGSRVRTAALCAFVLAAVVVPAAVTVSPAAARQTGGDNPAGVLAPPPGRWSQISQSFGIQNRTGAPLEQRYTFSGGVHTTRVFPGEERVEMRWSTWADQRREHLWEAEVMIEPGAGRVCIMQIKSNSDGEPIYIQIANGNGDLRNNGDSTPIARGMYGRWFNLKGAFNPVSGVGRVWIDDRLVKTRQYRTGTSGWYFKNGTYNNGLSAGQRAVVHFRDIRIYRAA